MPRKTTTGPKSAKSSRASSRSKKTAAPSAGTQEWSEQELAEVREALEAEVARLQAELSAARDHLTQLQRSAVSGGEDPADSGAIAYERESESAIADHASQSIRLCEDALARMGAGTFGICETCDQPIAKPRLQAFPRATQCISCKQKAERR